MNWFDLKGFDKKGKFQAATWEGCVVKLADKIAYLGRDIEDAIRLNYLSAKDKEFLQDMARVHNESAINTTVIMSTMTQPLSYEIITPGGYVMDKITHKVRCEQWTAIINECLASGIVRVNSSEILLMARLMIEDGKLSYEDIAMYTELTLEEVEKIALEKKSA